MNFKGTMLSSLLLAAVLVLSACGGGGKGESGDRDVGGGGAGGGARDAGQASLVEKLKQEMRDRAERKKKREILRELDTMGGAEVDSLVNAALDFLDFRFRNERLYYSRYMESFDRKLRIRQDHAAVLRELYAGSRYGLFCFEFPEKVPVLSANGKDLLELLKELPSHGLSPESYRSDSISKELAWFQDASAEYVAAKEGEFSQKEWDFWNLLSAYENMPDALELKRDLKKKGLANEDAVALKNFNTYYKKLLDSKFKLNESATELDMDLMAGFLQATLDFKLVRRAHPFLTNPGLQSPSSHKEELKLEWQTAAANPAAYLRNLMPDNPVYDRLRSGLALYEKLAADPEMAELRIKRELKPGAKGDAVRVLTKRLARENYLDPVYVGDRYGKEVVEAVKSYQRTHQMEVDGAVGPMTRKSLNASMESRVRSIRLGLQRWRESEIHKTRPPIYVRVNIPQFEAEVWEAGKLLRVHRVVVGNRNEEVSVLKKKRGAFNHTALLQSKIETVVLNPRWYPPDRIQAELLKDLEREPDYFEKNNFGFIQHDDGSETVFQKPGPENALGLVKFLFPNEYNVYMHDTPQKKLFERPVRAYSHGCMRTDRPLDLARFLLGRFAGIDESKMKEILASEKETWLKLEPPLPIFVEYCSVSADEEGRVRFFIDIYKYDEAYWEKKLPVQLTEDLSDWEIKRLSGTDGAIMEADPEDDGVRPE